MINSRITTKELEMFAAEPENNLAFAPNHAMAQEMARELLVWRKAARELQMNNQDLIAFAKVKISTLRFAVEQCESEESRQYIELELKLAEVGLAHLEVSEDLPRL